MKNLIFILLAFLAVFTFIRAFTNIEAEENRQEIPVEIVQ